MNKDEKYIDDLIKAKKDLELYKKLAHFAAGVLYLDAASEVSEKKLGSLVGGFFYSLAIYENSEASITSATEMVGKDANEVLKIFNEQKIEEHFGVKVADFQSFYNQREGGPIKEPKYWSCDCLPRLLHHKDKTTSCQKCGVSRKERSSCYSKEDFELLSN